MRTAGLGWRLLLRALPVELRAAYGDDLLQVTHDRLRAARRRGLLPWLHLVHRTAGDYIATAWRMRTAPSPLPESPDREWTPDMLLQDLKYALRLLLHRPGFTAAVVITLALGIGANTLIYSTVDTVVLNPFDLPDPDRVLAIGSEFPRLNQDLTFFESLSGPEYVDVATQARSLEAVAGFDMGNRQILGSETPTNLFTGFWWDDPLPVLGLQPLLGRSFSDEEIEQRAAVAMISERVWRSRFAADESTVGSQVVINDVPTIVIGVFPAAVNVYGTDLWTPMWVDPLEMPRGNRRQFNIIARRAEDLSLAEVNAELAAISRRVEQAHAAELQEYEDWSLRAMTWTGAQVRTLQPIAFALLATVALLLLLVCANVASLLLSRAAGRQREMAVRAALGAGRVRLVRQVLSESLLLAAVGALAGLAVAWLGLQWLQANLPMNLLPTTRPLALSTGTLLYTGAISLVAGVLFGMVPALHAARTDLQGALAQGSGAAGASRSRRRLYHTLVGAEVALAVVLLVSAGLFLTSLGRLQRLDPGVEVDGVLTMRLTLPFERYQGEQITTFFEELAERVESMPGVEQAASASQYPPIGFSRRAFSFPGQPVVNESEMPVALMTVASHDYFDTMGIPFRAGRGFGNDTAVDTPPVAVVNTTFANRYLEGDPIGQRVKLGRPEEPTPEFEIIGVVADTRNTGLQTPSFPELFASVRQAAGATNQLFLLVRSEGDPMALMPSIRDTVAQMDPDQPIYSIATLRDRMASGYATEALAMRMVSAFALLAVVLAATGIFGVVAYAVQRRSREIGLRLALGADASQVVRLVVRQSLLPAVIGAVVGVGLSVGAGVAMTGFLSEIQAFEPGALAGVLVALVLVALGASYLPARRASGIDPVESLRNE